MTDSDSTSASTGTRVLRWGGGVLGTLVVLVLIAALVLPRLFTSEQLKGYVIPPLEEATQRTVEIDDIGLRVLPFPAVRVTGFRLANDERFGSEPAVSARALNVDVALWPLFVANIRPKAIALEDPIVRYEIAEDGTTNFDTLGGEEDTTAAEEGSPLAGIPVSNFRATGAQVDYADHSTGTMLQLGFDTQLSALPEDNAIVSEGSVDLRSVRAVLPDVNEDTLAVQDATLDYDVRAALGKGRVDVRSLALDTAPLSLTASGVLTDLNTQPAVDLAVETGDTDLARIAAFAPAAAVEGVNPSGTLQLDATLQGPLPDSTHGLDDLQLDGTGQLQALGVDYEGEALLRDTDARLALSLDSIAVRSVEGSLLDASLAGGAAVRGLQEEPQLDLRLNTGPLDLARLAAFAPEDAVAGYNPQGTIRLDATATGPLPDGAEGLERLDFAGTGQLAGVGADYDGAALLRDLGASLSFSNASATLEALDGSLLGRPVEGEVTIRDPMGQPRVEGRLAGTADLDRLAALAGNESGVQGEADYDVQFSGPLDDPNAIRPNGQVRLADVQVPSESLREPLRIPDATVELTGGGLSMDRFTMQSGDQTMAMEATVQDLFPVAEGLAETNPAMAVDFTLTADRLDLVALQPESEDPDEATYSELVAAHLSGSQVQGQDPEALARERYGDFELPAYTADGRIEVGTLLNEPQRYDDLTLDLRLESRRLAVRNLTAETYGGQLTGSLTLDQSASESARGPGASAAPLLASASSAASPSAPSSDLTYDFTLEDAEAADLMDDWTTLGRLVSGTLDFSIDGNSALAGGLLPQADALTATGRSLVLNGGLSTNTGIAKTLTNVVGLELPSLSNLERLGGPFSIRDGAFQVDGWDVRGRGLKGTIGGAFQLNGGLDLSLEADLPLSALRGGRLLGNDEDLSGLLGKLTGRDNAEQDTVPVQLRIGGSMRDPKVDLLNRDAVRSSIRGIARDAGLLDRLRDMFNPGGGG